MLVGAITRTSVGSTEIVMISFSLRSRMSPSHRSGPGGQADPQLAAVVGGDALDALDQGRAGEHHFFLVELLQLLNRDVALVADELFDDH